MVFLQRSDVFDLLEADVSTCVSIYMPVEVTGRETRQNTSRLKNLIVGAEEKLRQRGTDLRTTRRVLAPALQLVEDEEFWSHRSRGLAVFLAPGESHMYWLPMEVEECATVGDRYRLRLALPAIERQGFCYLLTISQNHARLLEVSEHAIDELPVHGLPANMEEALNYAGADRGEQVHSAMAGGQVHSAKTGGHGKQAAVFHGQGGKADTAKDDLAAYFRVVDEAVVPHVASRPAPVMLACVDYLAPIYRRVSRLPNLLSRVVEGNPDYLSLSQLHHQAWTLFELELEGEFQAELRKLAEAIAKEKVIFQPTEVIPAAADGRVASLFIDSGRELWGSFQPEEGIIDVHDVRAEDDQDLLEVAARETLRHRGAVHCVTPDQLPTAAPMAAILRY